MAKRFIFRLAAVLKYRQRTEDDCRRRVAEALHRVAEVRNDLRLIDEELRGELTRSRHGQLGPSLDVVLVRRQRSYMTLLERRRLEGEERLRAFQTRLSVEQGALASAARDVKVMEKLRERQLSRWAEVERRAERVNEDEIGRQIFLSRRPALAD